MTTVLQVLHDGAFATGVATLIYTATIALTTITALAAPGRDQRRDARQVLALLLRRMPPR